MLKNDGNIKSIAEFYEQTGISKTLFSNVKNQDRRDRGFHFTVEQIGKIATLYDIDVNWIFAISDDFYLNKKKTLQH